MILGKSPLFDFLLTVSMLMLLVGFGIAIMSALFRSMRAYNSANA
jgi:hypothetical protein